MIVVGLDRAACAEALERLAPERTAGAAAEERAGGPSVPPAGAARRIAEHLTAVSR